MWLPLLACAPPPPDPEPLALVTASLDEGLRAWRAREGGRVEGADALRGELGQRGVASLELVGVDLCLGLRTGAASDGLCLTWDPGAARFVAFEVGPAPEGIDGWPEPVVERARGAVGALGGPSCGALVRPDVDRLSSTRGLPRDAARDEVGREDEALHTLCGLFAGRSVALTGLALGRVTWSARDASGGFLGLLHGASGAGWAAPVRLEQRLLGAEGVPFLHGAPLPVASPVPPAPDPGPIRVGPVLPGTVTEEVLAVGEVAWKVSRPFRGDLVAETLPPAAPDRRVLCAGADGRVDPLALAADGWVGAVRAPVTCRGLELAAGVVAVDPTGVRARVEGVMSAEVLGGAGQGLWLSFASSRELTGPDGVAWPPPGDGTTRRAVLGLPSAGPVEWLLDVGALGRIDDDLLVPLPDGSLVRRRRDGSTRWVAPRSGGIGFAAGGGGVTVIALNGGAVGAPDPETGAPRWWYRAPGRLLDVAVTPAVVWALVRVEEGVTLPDVGALEAAPGHRRALALIALDPATGEARHAAVLAETSDQPSDHPGLLATGELTPAGDAVWVQLGDAHRLATAEGAVPGLLVRASAGP